MSRPVGVSVIIPTLNRGNELTIAIRSVLSQTRIPCEVIVVDDGSIEDIAAVCAVFGDAVRCIRRENGGIAAARNTGLAAASQEFVALLDSDDLWEPSKIERQTTVLDRHPEAGWCLTDCVAVDENNLALPGLQGFRRVFPVFGDLGLTPDEFFTGQLMAHRIPGAIGPAYVGDAYELFFHGNFALPSSALIRRRLIDRIGGFDANFRVAEETEFFHRAAASSPVAVLMEPLTRYRVGSTDAASSGRNTAALISNALVSLERASSLREPLGARARRSYAATRTRLRLRLAYTHISNLNQIAARDVLREVSCSSARGRSLWLGLLWLAAYCPPPLLRMAGAIKRRLSA